MQNALYGYIEADVLPLNYSRNLFKINHFKDIQGIANTT
jgi:hypothetical protein